MLCSSKSNLKTLFFFFFFLLFSSLLIQSNLLVLADHGVVSDRLALLEFKTSLSSDPAGVLSDWNSNANSTGSGDHCYWFGVTCNSQSRVSAVNLTGSCSEGNSDPFSCSSLNLGFAKNCSGFGIKGKLSPSIGKLTELRVLSLSFNAFEGEIPVDIGGLARLEVLELQGNLLTGEIPAEISACVNLRIVNLSVNRLNGTVPKFLGELREVFLSGNMFSGNIPTEIGDSCENLEHLDLSMNSLTGSIPPGLGNCSNLKSLLLFSNMLGDSIPPDLGRNSMLRVLDVSRNSLSGVIPAELGRCRELSVLVLSNLYDPLPVGSDSRDDYNYFQGGLPVSITTLPKLRMIWSPRSTLVGSFPSDWGVCGSLEMVNLAQNFFTGGIPAALSRCKNLHFLDLSSNRLSGGLDEELPVPCMTTFDVGGNLLSGNIPTFVTGKCLRILGQSDPASVYLQFFSCRIRSGFSSPSFGFDDVGIFHNFSGNYFSGPVPPLPIANDRLEERPVYAFLASRNNLSGLVSRHLFEKCNELTGLVANLSNNQISGEFPAEIGTMCKSLRLLDVAANLIMGSIPMSLGQMDSLVRLDLSKNQLHGQIPGDFARLKDLRYLSLASNNLTGSIPAGLGKLPLVVLELSSNFLSGEIPSDLANLRNLTVLQLDHNKLSGQIPSGFADITSLAVFNLSYNNLSGSIPQNHSSLMCNSVVGNPLLQPCPVLPLRKTSSDPQVQAVSSQDYPYAPSQSISKNNNGFSSIEIASITSASAIVSVLLALIFLFVYTRKCSPRSSFQVTGRMEVITFTDIGVPLSFENVVRATGNFNASNCIGNGGFGATYKAEVSPGVLVAIKRLSMGRFQGVQQFGAEIRTLGRIRHPNLVTLIGYHVSETEMFLIYNYLSGGNLEKFIQERSKRPIDWRILHKIALDVAGALAYLHDQCVPRVLHRDIKPSNILLDDEFNAYVSDFGLARLLGASETHATTDVAGTFGYVAPEYAMTCRVSDKADVYSFGVVLLELISDMKALDPSFSSFGNGFNIVAWACMLLRQGRAREVFTAGLWDMGPHDALVETLHLAVMCTVETLSIRPTMKQVVQRLKQLQPPTW